MQLDFTLPVLQEPAICPHDVANESSAHPYPDLFTTLNPLNPELNPICHLLALLGAHHILHVSRIRVKLLHHFYGIFMDALGSSDSYTE
jgi:hypothetical protein